MQQDGNAAPDSLAGLLARVMDAHGLPDGAKVPRASALLNDIMSGAADDGAQDLEIAGLSDVFTALLAMSPSGLPGEAAEQKVRERLATATMPRIPGPFAEEGAQKASGLASLAAWHDPQWCQAISGLNNKDDHDALRDGWLWERGQILWALSRFRAEAGRERNGRALVVCEYPERLIGALGDLFTAIDMIDVRVLDSKAEPVLAELGDFDIGPVRDDAAFALAALPLAPAAYDAVIIPHSAIFRVGMRGLPLIITQLRSCLVEGGLCAIAGEMSLTGLKRIRRPDRALVAPAGMPAMLCRHAALGQIGPEPDRISRADAACIGSPRDRDTGRPVLGLVEDADILWPFVWLFEAIAAPRDDAALARTVYEATLGEQLPVMDIGPVARRSQEGLVIATGPAGHVMFGPFLPLQPGHYRAVIDVEGVISGFSPRIVAEICIDGRILVQGDLPPYPSRSFQYVFDLPFKVQRNLLDRGRSAGTPFLCEIRLWSDGTTPFVIRSVRVEPVGT